MSGAAAQRCPPGTPLEHAFLLRVAELLHVYGTPAHRLERVLVKVAATLGVRATFLSTPTSVFAALGAGEDERIHLLRVEPGQVDLGKLIEFDEVMEDVEDGRLAIAAATARLDAIAAAPSRYGAAARAAAYGIASAGAARFFGGGGAEILLSFLVGAGIFALGRALPRRLAEAGLFEPLSAFLAALIALFVAERLVPLDDRIATLASLIVLLPGLALTVGMSELATRHLVSGTARLAGAAATFLTLLLGVALAWRLGEALLGPGSVRVHAARPPAAWTLWLALALSPFAFGVLLEARPRELGVIWATSAAGFAAARLAATVIGAELGAFVGALVVGVASNLYARVADRPALVPSTPGLLLLVPGSLGYWSLTSFLDRNALVGVEWAFRTGLVAVSLAGGLLAANALLPPRRVL